MIELPEAKVLAFQIQQSLKGKTVVETETNASPHKLAWFFENPEDYAKRLNGKRFVRSEAWAGFVDLHFEDVVLTLGDGVRIRWFSDRSQVTQKHQLRLGFSDGSQLVGSIQMYGGLWCYPEGGFSNSYYDGALQKPSPLTEKFDREYFRGLIEDPAFQNLSTKAFLATEQRIPGLGNGVLQDLLWMAQIHPKTPIYALKPAEREHLFAVVKHLLNEMANHGGRDSEIDLFGRPGGYRTVLGSAHLDQPCPRCGSSIVKEAYLGGSIYYCPKCQPRI
jgi:formamidopyrimidine-DNA glycosylase